MTPESFNVYLKTFDNGNLEKLIEKATELKYSAVMTQVIHPEYKREFLNQKLACKQSSFTRSPMILDTRLWSFIIPLIIPPNVAVNDEELRENNRLQLEEEIRFAFHLVSRSAICIQLTNQDPELLGEIVKSMIKNREMPYKILIELPMTDLNTSRDAYNNDSENQGESEDMWIKWNRFHAATNYDRNIELALVMTSDLPTAEEIRRWIGEVIHTLIVPHYCFDLSQEGAPRIAEKYKTAFDQLLRYTKCSVTIEWKGNHENLYKMLVPAVTPNFTYFEDYKREDRIDIPLEPLFHNLSNRTYEIFENDPVKYVLYQRAIEAAMMDKITESEKETKKLRLMIVGAGRGPFIRCAVNACKNTGRKLKIIVVEKNPNLYITISSLIKVMWKREDIQLIMKDMRLLELEEKVDIIVSELLGSFGDNELSPECLDGAQKHLKPDGVSIPYRSISYVRPVMTSKLYREICQYQNEFDLERSAKLFVTKSPSKLYSKGNQITWLNYFMNVYYIDEAKEVYRFEHPNLADPIDNSRCAKINFSAKLDCVVNGFAGYFVAKLYKDIEISIHPKTHTPGMASWYPIFFPTPQPILLKANETFSFEMWRKVMPDVKVWYEWKTNDGKVLNEGGKVHPIFLAVQ